MASTKTKTETPGAVAAAFDVLEEASVKTGKAKDVLFRHCTDLQEQATELSGALAAEKADHLSEVARLTASRDRDVQALKAAVNELEKKLAKVTATLLG